MSEEEAHVRAAKRDKFALRSERLNAKKRRVRREQNILTSSERQAAKSLCSLSKLNAIEVSVCDVPVDVAATPLEEVISDSRLLIDLVAVTHASPLDGIDIDGRISRLSQWLKNWFEDLPNGKRIGFRDDRVEARLIDTI